MDQLELFPAAPAQQAPSLTWIRRPWPRTGYADYDLAIAGEPTGVRVRWCGHPTALRKYYVRLADGRDLDIYDRGGLSTFRTSAEAKAAAEAAWRSGA